MPLHRRHVPLYNTILVTIGLGGRFGLVTDRGHKDVFGNGMASGLVGSRRRGRVQLKLSSRGFVTTQICKAVALAVQTLLAREMAAQ